MEFLTVPAYWAIAVGMALSALIFGFLHELPGWHWNVKKVVLPLAALTCLALLIASVPVAGRNANYGSIVVFAVFAYIGMRQRWAAKKSVDASSKAEFIFVYNSLRSAGASVEDAMMQASRESTFFGPWDDPDFPIELRASIVEHLQNMVADPRLPAELRTRVEEDLLRMGVRRTDENTRS